MTIAFPLVFFSTKQRYAQGNCSGLVALVLGLVLSFTGQTFALEIDSPLNWLSPQVQECTLDGKPYNRNVGGQTAGGLLRCTDKSTGKVYSEETLVQGQSSGLMRVWGADGARREYGRNPRGERDGEWRQWNPQGQLVVQAQYKNGALQGLTKVFHANAQLARELWHDNDKLVAERGFNAQGQLTVLQGDWGWPLPGLSAATPSNGAHLLYREDGKPLGKVEFQGGKLVQEDRLWDDGKLRMRLKVAADGRIEQNFSPTGVIRREIRWAGANGQKVLDQVYDERGNISEQREWAPNGRVLALTSWYQNGKVSSKTSYDAQGNREESDFATDGKLLRTALYARDGKAISVHRSYHPNGTLGLEEYYDPPGQLARIKRWDKKGNLERDQAVFPDGSPRP